MDLFKILLLILSAYIIPLLVYKGISKFIASENLAVLISNIIYLLFLIAIFHKSFFEEFKIFKNNFRNCVKTGLKYWGIGLIVMMISNLIINLIIF